MSFDPRSVRPLFPSLGSSSIFFDNPGGTQVPQPVIDAVVDTFRDANANLGGAFRTSRAADAVMDGARRAAADLLGTDDPREVVLGQNMTSLAFHLARSLAARIGPGDQILVTRLDHDANIAPWTTMARDVGAEVVALDFDPADCTLRLDRLDDLLTDRTRLVAVGWASNAVGTINPVAEICARARDVGALTFVDAVQYAPHASMSVREVGCDFLACSAYKFFGPHVGLLWGRFDLLDELEAYKVRPSRPSPPEKFETGTLNHEGIAGVTAAIDYLAGLAGGDAGAPRRQRLEGAFAAMLEYEQRACRHLIATLSDIDGVRIRGITDPERAAERVPTVAVTVDGMAPGLVAEELGRQEIFVWSGDYYAVDVVDDLGLRDEGGMVRIGLAHYNTIEEIEHLGRVLREIVSRHR